MAAAQALLIRFAGQELRVEGPVTVGRDPGCDLVCEDPRVSRRHATIRPTATGWELEDLGSSNGTYYNGEAVSRVTLAGLVTLRLANPVDGSVLELIPAVAGTMIERPSARPAPPPPPDTLAPGRLSAINRMVHDLGAPEPPER